jgi:hypothetical protein
MKDLKDFPAKFLRDLYVTQSSWPRANWRTVSQTRSRRSANTGKSGGDHQAFMSRKALRGRTGPSSRSIGLVHQVSGYVWLWPG